MPGNNQERGLRFEVGVNVRKMFVECFKCRS